MILIVTNLVLICIIVVTISSNWHDGIKSIIWWISVIKCLNWIVIFYFKMLVINFVLIISFNVKSCAFMQQWCSKWDSLWFIWMTNRIICRLLIILYMFYRIINLSFFFCRITFINIIQTRLWNHQITFTIVILLLIFTYLRLFILVLKMLLRFWLEYVFVVNSILDLSCYTKLFLLVIFWILKSCYTSTLFFLC